MSQIIDKTLKLNHQLCMFPKNIHVSQVEFDRMKLNPATGENETRVVKRTLFGRMNPFPQKKVMTFNKYTNDFGFTVSYGDLQSTLRPDDLECVYLYSRSTCYIFRLKPIMQQSNYNRTTVGIRIVIRSYAILGRIPKCLFFYTINYDL